MEISGIDFSDWWTRARAPIFNNGMTEDFTDYIIREINKLSSSPKPTPKSDSQISNKILSQSCKQLELKIKNLEREQELLKQKIENISNKKKIVIK